MSALCPIQCCCRLPITPDHHRAESGFTLVEVLVGLALSTLLILGLSYSFRNFALTEERITDAIDSLDESYKAKEFLQQIVSQASLRNLNPNQALGYQLRWYELTPTSLEWIGVMPLRHSTRSEHFFRITSATVDGFNTIVLLFAPTAGVTGPPDWSGASQRVLFKDITQFKVNVEFARSNGQSHKPNEPLTRWRNTTSSRDEIPVRVQMAWLDRKGHERIVNSPVYLLDQYRDPTVAEFPK